MKQHCSCNEQRDFGGEPYILNINHASRRNNNFRTTIWTGQHLQTTLMNIPIGGEIGVELHTDTDQFIRIVEGRAMVQFGKTKDTLKNVQQVDGNFAVFVPAGTWHNIINIGRAPLKLYSVYAPPHHPKGTVEPYPTEHH